MLGQNAHPLHHYVRIARNLAIFVACAKICLAGEVKPLSKQNKSAVKPLATIASLNFVDKTGNGKGAQADDTCSRWQLCPKNNTNIHYVHGTAFVADQKEYLAIYCQGFGIRFRGEDHDSIVRDRSFHAAAPITAIRDGKVAFVENIIFAYEGYNSVILKIEVWDGDKKMVTYDPLKRPPRKVPGTDIIIGVNQVLKTSTVWVLVYRLS
ncbi:uncharacterized protein LOC129587432 [Paramacrobiotus metropolitanus]|uniref:uncharacterized protein LOC129587432 n=1 Tax=Paramacrobiotus metropolitanus TaxID=2943436 RepID=UPI0024456B8C|nr:uncharacterized protein LOC129587432 [Paramacrobiotus metropolitanus]